MASIMSPVSPEDLKELAPILNHLKLLSPPNVVTDIFKARRSRYKDIRIFSYIDLGTCRQKDLFATDKYLNPINIDILKLIIDEEGQEVKQTRSINLAFLKKAESSFVGIKEGF